MNRERRIPPFAEDVLDAESEPPPERTTAMVGERPNQASLAAAAGGG